MSSDDIQILDYFFGGILANFPLWIVVTMLDGIDSSSLSYIISIVLSTILGGALSGYLIRIKSQKIYKWSPAITALLAFFASILILGSSGIGVIDFILVFSFIVGAYSGTKLGGLHVSSKVVNKSSTEAAETFGERESEKDPSNMNNEAEKN